MSRLVSGSVFCGTEPDSPLADVLVSDGETVTATTAQGHFDLPVAERARHVFVCPPAGFRVEGGFYQHWRGQRSLDFRLTRAPESASSEHSFILLADYQWEPNDTMRAVFRRILADPARPQFIVHVGDLFYMMEGAPADLARRYYTAYRDILPEFGVPVYNLIGNHDQVNGPPISPEMPEFADGLFEELLGPTYYSFNWGQVHYVVLNSFEIVGTKQHSRISRRQLLWLRNDLSRQPADRPVILFAHRSPRQMENREDLLSLLRKRRVLACFAGDWHRDAVFQCQGQPFPTVVTVSPLENRLGLPPGYRAVWVHGSQVQYVYRMLHSLNELHIVRPAPDSQVSGAVELLVTEHLRSDLCPQPAYSVSTQSRPDEIAGSEWIPLRPEPLPLERIEGCQTRWAQWGTRVEVSADTTLTLRAAAEAAPDQWIRLPLKAVPSPLLWRRAIRQSGDVLWRSQATVADGLVIVGEDGGVRAFRASDGEVAWEHREEGHWIGTPLEVDGRVLVTSWESTILALDLNNGHPVWRHRQECAIPPARACLADDRVLIGGMKRDGIWDGSLTCLDLESGSLCWSLRYDHPYFAPPLYSCAGTASRSSGAGTPSRSSGGRVWAACGDVVRCLALENGRELWSYRPEHFSLYGPMAIAEGRLFAADIDGWTYVLDPDSGKLLGRRLLPRGTGFSSDGHVIYASCGVRGLRAFAPLSLDELWAVHRPGTYYSGFLTLRSRDLVATCSDGNVSVVSKQSGTTEWSFQLGDIDGTTVALDADRGYLITGSGELLAFQCPVDWLPKGSVPVLSLAGGEALQRGSQAPR